MVGRGRAPGSLRALAQANAERRRRASAKKTKRAPDEQPTAPPHLRPFQTPERMAELRRRRERALHDPGLRQAGPLLAVHLARGERARQPAVGESGRQQGGRHLRRVSSPSSPRPPRSGLTRRVVNLRESLSSQQTLNEIGPEFSGLTLRVI